MKMTDMSYIKWHFSKSYDAISQYTLINIQK